MHKPLSNILMVVVAAMLAMVALSGCHSSRTSVTRSSGSSRPAAAQHIDINPAALPTAAINLLKEANTWIGVPYRYGGENRSGVDCSALVQQVFQKSVGVKVPRNSRKQAEFCATIKQHQLTEGDLVFFSTNSSSEIGHVGIYVGKGQIIHASSSRGVVISNLEEPYFQRHFKKAGRVDAYYALLDNRKRSKSSKKQPETNSATTVDDGSLLATATPPPSPKPNIVVTGQISAEEFALQSQATAAQLEASEAVATVAAAVTTVVQPEEQPAVKPVANIETQPVVPAVASEQQQQLSTEEARRRVLNAFREQPADSVLTSYFE